MLPKIEHPIFTLELPISKKKIKYRPMIVKEEKILLVAKESMNDDDIVEAVKAVIQNCVHEKLDFNTLPLIEVEYILLNIRAKSINNILRFKIIDEYNKKIKHDVEFDASEVTIVFDPKQNKNIKLNDNIGIILKYPTINSLKNIKFDAENKDFYRVILNSIESVYDENTVYKFVDYSEMDRVEFIEGLTSPQLDKIKVFFENLPKLNKKIEYINSKQEVSSLTLDSFRDFF